MITQIIDASTFPMAMITVRVPLFVYILRVHMPTPRIPCSGLPLRVLPH